MITTERMHKFTEVRPGIRVTKVLLYFKNVKKWKIVEKEETDNEKFYKSHYFEYEGEYYPTHWEELE